MSRSRNLTLHKLNVFCTIARFNSVTRAAEHLNIAQPAVTAHLRSLEDSLDARLVRKVGRNIELTEAGQRTYQWATEVMQRSSEMLLDLADIRKGISGKTKIATSMVAGTYKLSEIVIEFKKHHPSMNISVSTATPFLATEAVLSGDCDFGVTLIDPSRDTSRLEMELLWREPLFLVAATDSKLVGDVAYMHEIATLPLVTPPKGQMARELIEEALRAVGVVRTNSVLAFGHPEPILNAIRADIGAGFVYQSALPPDPEKEGLRLVRTPEMNISLPLFLVYDKQATFSVMQTKLLDIIRQRFAALAPGAIRMAAQPVSEY
ncbi:LysR family transcriptional regulator [Pelagibaca abyssi]|nr:LysR family transcriptional regulator [Salipiger abyssi]